MSPVLSLLSCTTSTDSDEEFDWNDSPIASTLDGKKKGFKSFIKPSRRGSKRRISISGPTNFRHDVHLGQDLLKADRTYMLWDADRWRLELAKKDLILPPLDTPQTPSQTPTTSKASKRNSFTPQKRKPVPALYPDIPLVPSLDLSLAPHEIPLPPSPTISATLESEDDDQGSVASIPPLDPPSRGPSIDGSSEDDELLAQALEKRWERPKSLIPPSIKEEESPTEIHEPVFQLQT